MKKTIMLLVVFAVLAGIVSSCNKDKTPLTSTTQTDFAQKVSFIQGVHSSVFDLICQASNDTNIMNGAGSINGVYVMYNAGLKMFTFTKGTTDTVLFIATLSGGKFGDSATTCVVNFVNYVEGGNLIVGSDIITNLGGSSKKSGTVMNFSDSIVNSKMINSIDTTTFSANYTIKWFAGVTTASSLDDQFSFQGNYNVATNHNSSVTGTISPTNALIITTQCPYIVSGVMNMTMHTLNTNNQNVTNNVIVDFITDDGCNSLVEVMVDNTQYQFTLSN